jgi:ATP-dependent DNA helicase RecG
MIPEAVKITQLEEWMRGKEGEHCEFKEAKNRYDFEELGKYCCALANEGGGRVILGVTNSRPRQVVGTRAFAEEPERTRCGLCDRLPLAIDFEEIAHPGGRVLVFFVPSRPVGTPMKWGGRYWMRKGDSLTEMSEERLREIFAESGHDFSADICESLTLNQLDSAAIEDFRRRWIAKSSKAEDRQFAQRVSSLPHEQLLTDSEALVEGKLTYAALILFGTAKAVSRYLA